MSGIDGLLNLVDRQGANELRLGSDREPQMFADGIQKRLVIPKTSMETLRELLADVLTAEREKTLNESGHVQTTYEAPGLGPFRVTFTRRGPAWAPLQFDAVFQRARKVEPAPAPPRLAEVSRPANDARIEPPAAVQPAPTAATPAGLPPATHANGPSFGGGFAPGPRTLTPGPELSNLLAQAAAMRASDVHLADGEPPVLRVDGRLRPAPNAGEIEVERLLGPAIAAEAKARMAHGASADLAIGVESVGRFRLNVFVTADGFCAAIRLLQSAPPALSQLGSPVPLDDVIDLPHGLVVVCGPTGSGKSTTLASIAREALVRRHAVVLTLEDPIEYVLSGRGRKGLVRQRQVGRDVRDFATGLRDALREDPDILLIGEMRDPETISLALTAAETGHLVLASLHSRSAASAVERIVDVYAPERQTQIRVQLADSLRMVIAQRLIPRANGDGRVMAAEVMRVNHAVANAIREAKTATVQSAIQSGRRDGMLPLERCLADLVQKRQITMEEARAVANEPAALTGYLSG
ncbi:MAG: PilT/PilU family type 4a pilus ATPase [Polyangiaceae bacterium]